MKFHFQDSPASGASRCFPAWALVVAASLILGACAGSSEDARGTAAPAGPARGQSPPPEGTVPAFPPGKFTVQLGAFQSEDGAAAVADLARSRFAREVYTVRGSRDGLFKVMLGVFDTKELARSFRDTIVRQFPQEYNDAWVSELGG